MTHVYFNLVTKACKLLDISLVRFGQLDLLELEEARKKKIEALLEEINLRKANGDDKKNIQAFKRWIKDKYKDIHHACADLARVKEWFEEEYYYQNQIPNSQNMQLDKVEHGLNGCKRRVVELAKSLLSGL